MIDIRRRQRNFGDGFIRETVDELWESWMRHADAILADEELLETIHHALLQQHPRSHAWPARHTRRSGVEDAASQAHP